MSSSEEEYKKFSKEINGGSVYILYKPGVEKFYIGSSIQKLNNRLSRHKSSCKNESRNSPLYQTMRETGIDEWIIEPISHYPDIKIKAELLQKEQEFIDKVDKQFLLNKQKSTSGCKSKRECMRECVRELRQDEEYRQREREQKNAKRRERVLCPHCPPDAKDFSRGSLPNHIDTFHPNVE